MRLSLSSRITLLVVANVVATGVLVALAGEWWPVAVMVAVVVGVWSSGFVTRRIRRTLDAVSDGVRGFRDGDYGVRLVVSGDDEVADVMRLYNDVGEVCAGSGTTSIRKSCCSTRSCSGRPSVWC
ncbi:MAG TPA: hypothetical protein VGF69_02285 [Thermoanaerobaculia bacterium]|jgi:methyl-accepting chemotaxis protein